MAAGRDIKFKVKLLDQSVQELELDPSVSVHVSLQAQSRSVSANSVFVHARVIQLLSICMQADQLQHANANQQLHRARMLGAGR